MSLSINARDLCTRALQTIGAIGQDQIAAPPADIQTMFQLLGELIDSWSIQALTVLTVNRQVYAITANQGGPDNPYTYGPGGDWNTGSAARPPSIQSANLLLATSGVSPIRIPVPILTTDMTAATPTPTLTNTLFTTLYYNDAVPLGQVILWPIPSTTVNQIELWVPLVTGAFPDLSTQVVCAPGYLKAFRLCLAESAIPFFSCPPEQVARIPSMAADALKNSNLEMSDLSFDPMYTPPLHSTYVIQTDEGA